MSTSTFIGLMVVVTIVLGSLLAYRGVQRMVFPLRKEMTERGMALLRSGKLNRREIDLVRFCLDDALSFSAGWLPIEAIWMALVSHRPLRSAGRGETHGQMVREDVVHGVVARFLASVLAANPIAFVAFVPMVIVLMIARREQPRPAIREAAASLPMTHGFCAP